MKNWQTSITLAFFISFLLSCGKSELQKVVDHYRNEGNGEKLAAAYFLIKNMDMHQSFAGETYESYMKFYDSLSSVMPNKRQDTISKFLGTSEPVSDITIVPDREIITSEYLIKHIDFVYDLWKKVPWSKKVTFPVFCEYMLPYKIYNEGISNNDTLYQNRVKDVLSTIQFESGTKYRAIDQSHRPNDSIVLNDFDVCTIVRLHPKSKTLLFDSINSLQESIKDLKLQYTSSGKVYPHIKISINKIDTVVQLTPTANILWFPSRRFSFPIKLKKGINTIEISPLNDSIAVDYIEVINYENFYRNLPDYNLVDGANYVIKNVGNSNSLKVDEPILENFSLIKHGKYIDSSSQKFNIQNIDYGFFRISPTHIEGYRKSLEVLGFSPFNYDSIGQWDYYGGTHQQWAIIPESKGIYKILNRLNGKCLQALPDNDLVVQNDYSGLPSQLWKFERTDTSIVFDSLTHITQDTPLEYVLRLAQAIDFQIIQLPSFPAMTPNPLFKSRVGTCKEEAQYILYVMRSLGIPSSVDYNPQKPNTYTGHYWDVLIGEDYKKIIYQNGIRPGTGNIEPPAKVFRNTFSYNRKNLFFNKDSLEVIPERFNNPFLHDVTHEYCITKNVKIPLFQQADQPNYKHCYLALFDNVNWVPIYWGDVNKGSSLFRNMGINVLYLPVYYTDSKEVQPASFPFILSDNSVKTIIPDKNNTQTLVLKRKFPWWWTNHGLNNRMNGGRFQGANKADFSDAVTLFTFRGDTEPIFYNVPSSSRKKFKYARYIGGDGSFSTINEISFIDEKNQELKGKIIGTDGSFKSMGSVKENAFDKNILTCFDGPTMNGSWVGLEFDHPQAIKTIRFIPRNDGNCIEIGDTYELVYWNNYEWESLGTQIASTDSVKYDNCPQNALFLLHNKTKGTDERIFTIENGKQVWW